MEGALAVAPVGANKYSVWTCRAPLPIRGRSRPAWDPTAIGGSQPSSCGIRRARRATAASSIQIPAWAAATPASPRSAYRRGAPCATTTRKDWTARGPGWLNLFELL